MVRQRAITLIETLVYLAVFGVMFTVVIAFMLSVSESNRRSLVQNEVERSVLFLFNHMEDTFNRASAINAGTSVFDNNNGVLHLTAGTDDYIYRLDSQRIEFSEEGVDNFISSGELRVTQLRFEPVELSDGSLVGIRVVATYTSDKFPDVVREVESAFLLDF
ncbi:MAG: hypothetical protein TR69_WS6001000306 [candidate division WS6 bacterium OLB20]|uniref:Type II secretion system protein n=1 Tax=candidate division WS6 bacterium OLB20 TaxID=1617426 RepID=A0A136M0J7_9BACT|nr:MAG: hypothetical protein TR69_WS6001000306 [candidate division WS6 bacterium OLB20]